MTEAFVSVIIPVYNDPERLETCLDALERQSYPTDAYEVIAVDNNSDESIEGIVDMFPHAVSAFEANQGSYAARNRGIQVAHGGILAFTDADCIPASDWIETGVRRLEGEDSGVGIVGGEIEMTFQDPDAPKPAEILDAMTGFDQKAVCTKRNFSATANLFTFRHVIEDVGNFDDRLKSAGDKEFGHRVVRNGYRIAYEPEAIVRHPARDSPRALFKKRVRLAKGQYDLRVTRDAYSLPELLVDSIKHLMPIPKYTSKILNDPRFVSPIDRLRAVLIYVIMELIFPFEKIRLWIRNDTPENV